MSDPSECNALAMITEFEADLIQRLICTQQSDLSDVGFDTLVEAPRRYPALCE